MTPIAQRILDRLTGPRWKTDITARETFLGTCGEYDLYFIALSHTWITLVTEYDSFAYRSSREIPSDPEMNAVLKYAKRLARKQGLK